MESGLIDGVFWYVVFLFSTVCHEAAHAWVALKLGDDTAARGGQVSLNPIPHVRREIIGMVVMPLISWFSMGWIMGWASAPYNLQWARTWPKRAAVMAIAGPAANLSLAILAGWLIRVGLGWNVLTSPFNLGPMHLASPVHDGVYYYVARFLSIAVSLNLLLCVFNLLPIPPLDGSSLPLLLLPKTAAEGYSKALHSPVVRLIGLFIVLRGIGPLFPMLLRFAAKILYPSLNYG